METRTSAEGEVNPNESPTVEVVGDSGSSQEQ